ncbi:Short-chain dehydrogenase [Asanoa hainanensis]|uniref:Short-chain dehydrogenase n=1 Tax=Asanoa hainanensis TaxID=560556 RepID=A0A239P230_9ACTN|nr:SDR family oxidoreductase [Asanoa hainanensis]SNT61177.1 Short-chain dehydrogenase [Asanoa hainanensis]
MTQIALITGANKGIGYATARALGELGMTVLLGARDEGRGVAATRELAGLSARYVALDVTDAASVTAAADWVAAEFGRLDVLVNNAGIVRADGAGLPSATTLPTMREVFETNVYGVVTVTNAFLPLLRLAPAARIVNVSSEVGSISSMTDPASPLFALTSVPYPASKAALNMITAMYAKELRDTPIKVNAANPGYTATDFNSHHGFRTPAQAARVCAHLATLPADGPSGLLWGHLITLDGDQNGVLAW